MAQITVAEATRNDIRTAKIGLTATRMASRWASTVAMMFQWEGSIGLASWT